MCLKIVVQQDCHVVQEIKVEAWVMGISACKSLFYGREVSFVFAI
jgi:hypothetical protein